MSEDCREAFEKWAGKAGYVLAYCGGHYHESCTQFAWLGWQAASDDEAAHADMLAAELIALANEAEGHAAACRSGELMNACAKANKAWVVHIEKRRRKHVAG